MAKMQYAQLPITALPAWAKLNDVDFLDTAVQDLGTSKGFGIATTRALSSKDISDTPTLLIVPHDLILSTEAIEEHSKVDPHFRQLLEVTGCSGLRDHAMLFLLMQITIASVGQKHNVGLSGPWTEYVKMLPAKIPVPTMWSEEERYMLTGTSLETAIRAKMEKLQKEFDDLREKTEDISWCQKCWWQDNSLIISDWVLLDAWFRSRSLELPNSGEAMVPCLDMANHSATSNAYWEQVDKNNVALLLRPDLDLEVGSEISISYGTEKSPAEMLFSYGFINESSSVNSLILPVSAFPDDPFGKAKVAAFRRPPIVSILKEEDTVKWVSPFLYLMCLNEEDGLDFGVLQEVDGSRSALHVFWQEKDVTEEVDKFETLISDHPLKEVFQLRVVALLHDRLRQQLEELYGSEEDVGTIGSFTNTSRQKAVSQLRASETSILEAAFEALDSEKQALFENDNVLKYLGSMEGDNARKDEEGDEANEEEDFS